MEILNTKTCRNYNKALKDRTICVGKTYVYISKETERSLSLTESDRLSFAIDSGKVIFMFDKQTGFPLYRKEYDNKLYIFNSDLSRALRKHGKSFVIDEFKEGKYILRKIK